MHAAARPAPLAPSRPVLKQVEDAVRRFALIEPGDRVAVAISGGKDSLLLACAIRALAARADLPFEYTLVHLDQHQPGFDRAGFEAALADLDFTCEVISADTWSVVEQQLRPGQIPCSICGRLRRGVLNRWSAETGHNKLALGHHLDDAIETFFLNLLYGRRLDPLKPATPTQDGAVTAIRPLILVAESNIRAWVDQHGVAPIACPVCDTFPDSKRRDLKQLVGGLSGLDADLHAAVRDALYRGESLPLVN